MSNIVIIGLNSPGLSMLRLLSRAGHKVIAFTNTKKSVGYYSKYGEKRLFTSVEDLKYQICKIISSKIERVKCIITSGELLALIIDQFPELYDMCDVESGPLDLVKMLSYKHQMYEFARNRGLQCANYKLLSEYKPGDLNFPVILKRNYEIPLFFKIKTIKCEADLFKFSKKINKGDYKHVLIQEFINVKDYIFITYQAYLKNGVTLGAYIGNQKRRLAKGLTSFLEEIKDEHLKNEIKKASSDLFFNTNYTGFVEVEYIFHPNNFNFFFMEVNTRSCGTHSVLNHKFENFSEIFNNVSNPSYLIENKNDIFWVNIIRDIRARIANNDFRNTSQFFTSKKDIFDWDDLKPFIMQFFK